LKPTVVSAFAAIESKEEFQKRCQDERRRLGVGGVHDDFLFDDNESRQ